MREFRTEDVEQLLGEADEESFVSCFLPLERAGRETRKNAIQLRNMLRDVTEALQRKGFAKRVATAYVERIGAHLDNESPQELRQNDGLAVFADAEQCLTFGCAQRFAPRLTIARRFDVLPLLSLVDRQVRGHVLVLARDCVRLVEVTSDGGADVELKSEMPRSLTDVVGEDIRDSGIQQHTVGAGAIFHGHGEGEDDVLPELELYCRRVAEALAALPEVASAPLLIAADVKLAALFRRAADKLDVLEATIAGNHERNDAAGIAGLAKPELLARNAARIAARARDFQAAQAAGRASDDAETVWRAARDARVDTLLIAESAALDGQPADEKDPTGERSGNAETVLTLRHGGHAHVLARAAMPTQAPLAAVFRY